MLCVCVSRNFCAVKIRLSARYRGCSFASHCQKRVFSFEGFGFDPSSNDLLHNTCDFNHQNNRTNKIGLSLIDPPLDLGTEQLRTYDVVCALLQSGSAIPSHPMSSHHQQTNKQTNVPQKQMVIAERQTQLQNRGGTKYKSEKNHQLTPSKMPVKLLTNKNSNTKGHRLPQKSKLGMAIPNMSFHISNTNSQARQFIGQAMKRECGILMIENIRTAPRRN